MIQGLQGLQAYAATTQNQARQGQVAAVENVRGTVAQVEQSQATFTGDRVTLSSQSVSLTTYARDLRMQGDQDIYGALRSMVVQTLRDQGYALEIPEAGINFETMTPEEASDLIADDGYFGIDQTSQRIVDFAISLTGNDPSRIDAIRRGVEKGFKEAMDAFGGELPEISQQTYDAVMGKLDDWVEDTTALAS